MDDHPAPVPGSDRDRRLPQGHAEFPRQHARTRRFTLGLPRDVTVSPDGERVVFSRSRDGEDPVTSLWCLDTASGDERCVADAALLQAADHGDLPAEERAHRERTREVASGITGYSTDRAVTLAVFALAGKLHVADLVAGTAGPHPVEGAVIDPRPDPTGSRIAYVQDGGLSVVGVDGGAPVRLAAEDGATWGLAEFIAAEEMRRTRGFWWAPDGQRLAVARVDESPVARWHIGEPADPGRPPSVIAYPAAGTANARVGVFVVGLDGGTVEVAWDRDAFEYLVDVVWDDHGPLTLVVQSRDQRSMRLLAVDPTTGATSTVRDDEDAAWLEVVPGVPRWLPGGRLVHTLDRDDTRRLAIDGQPVTPPGLQVRHVISAADDGVLVAASSEPTRIGVWRVPGDGGAPVPVTPTDDGVHDARAAGGTTVVISRTLHRSGETTVVRRGADRREIRGVASAPVLTPRVELLRLGPRGLRAALLLPSERPDGPLPVLLDPYGGPHAQRVLESRDSYLTSQWFADAGFAVLVVDGRGSPGRGPAWERTLAEDLASAPLEDQVEALRAAADQRPELDLGRVAIRGWSFGGFLAALAILRRPDVFHAAVAGAPVTDWALYDTHYTERYLGRPQEEPAVYRTSSLIDDASALRRPLLLIHGLADDNVVVAHTLRLSRALLEAGRPHQVLPLSGITHMTPQEAVAENLLRLQLAFLRDALDL